MEAVQFEMIEVVQFRTRLRFTGSERIKVIEGKVTHADVLSSITTRGPSRHGVATPMSGRAIGPVTHDTRAMFIHEAGSALVTYVLL